MIFDKAAQQWVCSNPLELVTGMRLCHLLMLKKVSSIIAGTVLVYERNDTLIMFQTNEILYIHYLTEESGVDFEEGSCVIFDKKLLRWDNYDLHSFPPFSKCRLPSVMELDIYNKICNL